ncbi:hypothetical protein [Mucilaginibacter gracilis]|uniref:hypothetical protein n=1 Tax=Mucilaginibacter gracilis TaxID=423350 RepID=UPI001FE5F39F|nr:hypothetical protein [Mucilaginibacter gracilis]
MTRGLGLVSCLLILGSCARAQTWAEWWSQKKTQISYLGQQIAALQVYASYLKKGYDISQHGLGVIGDWKDGEFSLHRGYYNSLKTVNPRIKDNPKASAIEEYLQAIPGLFDQVLKLSGLSADNRQYIGSVRDKMLTECDRDVSELQLVMTSGKTEMTDDERLKRLDQLYDAAQDKYRFTQHFCNQVRLLVLETERRLYEVP